MSGHYSNARTILPGFTDKRLDTAQAEADARHAKAVADFHKAQAVVAASEKARYQAAIERGDKAEAEAKALRAQIDALAAGQPAAPAPAATGGWFSSAKPQ